MKLNLKNFKGDLVWIPAHTLLFKDDWSNPSKIGSWKYPGYGILIGSRLNGFWLKVYYNSNFWFVYSNEVSIF